jgi:hypothetical protein
MIYPLTSKAHDFKERVWNNFDNWRSPIPCQNAVRIQGAAKGAYKRWNRIRRAEEWTNDTLVTEVIPCTFLQVFRKVACLLLPY